MGMIVGKTRAARKGMRGERTVQEPMGSTRKIPVAHDTSLPVDQTDQEGWGRQGMRIRFYLVGLGMAALATAPGQPAEEAADPKGSSISVWSIAISPRGLELPAAPGRFLTEVYDPEVGWSTDDTLFPDGAELGPGPERPRQNDPLFFRFTDFELDLSFTGYTAWDQLDARFFTYPISEEWRELFAVDTTPISSCDAEFRYACSIYSTYSVADSITKPSYYVPRFREWESITGYFRMDFLPDNNKFPRDPWVRNFNNGQATSQFSFIDPEVFTNCSEAPGNVCESLSEGGVIYTKVFDGYTTFSIQTRYEPCYQTNIRILHAPSTDFALSPSDILPPGFPFPPPDDFIAMAIEDMIITKGNPVGFLQRAVQPRGPLYSTTSLSALPVGANLDSNITWTLPELIGFPGVGVTVPLVVSGGVDNTSAVSLALRLQSPVPLAKESLTATPAITGTTIRDHIRAIDDHTLEYRCLVRGEFSTSGNTTIANLLITLPETLQPGDRIELIPLLDPIDNVLPTSLVDMDNRPVINPACGDGPCQVQSSPGRIKIVEKIEGADMWILLGDSVE